MPTNVVLVRWSNGFHEVTYADSVAIFGRSEALLDLGSFDDMAQIDHVAGLQLEAFGIVRTKIAVDHDPLSVADRPYRSYNIADSIDVPAYPGDAPGLQRVRTITASEDENGDVTYAPELGDVVLEEQERINQAVKKMIDGTKDGEMVVAQPTRLTRIPVQSTQVRRPRGWDFGAGAAPPGSAESSRLTMEWTDTVTTLSVSISYASANPVVVSLMCNVGDGGDQLVASVTFAPANVDGIIAQRVVLNAPVGPGNLFFVLNSPAGIHSLIAVAHLVGQHPSVTVPWVG